MPLCTWWRQVAGAGAGAVSWLCTWWRQGAGAGAGCWLCAWWRQGAGAEQSRIQKLHCIQKLVFRNYFVVFRNYFVVFRNSCIQKLFRRIQKLFSSYSETISSYSETISSYSETIFVVFRNYFRRIQKLLFLMLRNFYSQTRGQCEQSHAWTVDAFSCIQGGVGGLGWGSK